MKTKIILAAMIVCSILAYGQKTEIVKVNDNSKNPTQKKDSINQIIEYDFSKGYFTKALVKPKRGKNVVLVIKNINPLFYNITITPKDIEINDTSLFSPSQISPPKTSENAEREILPKEIPIKTTDIAKLEIKKELTSTQKASIEKVTDFRIDEIQKELLANKEKIEIAETKKGKVKESLDIIENELTKEADSSKKNVLSQKVTETKNQISNFEEIINLIAERNNDLKIEKEKINKEKVESFKNLKSIIEKNLEMLNKKYKNFSDQASYLNHLNENYTNFLDKINDPELTFLEYQKIKNPENDIEHITILDKTKFKNFFVAINKFDEFKNSFLEELKNYNQKDGLNILKTFDEGLKIAENIESEYARLSTVYAETEMKINNLQLRKKLNYVETVDRKLSDSTKYTYQSNPIQPWGDYLEFDVIISGRKTIDDNYYLPLKNKVFKYSEYVRSGIRWDFSVGTILDFGLKDKEFAIVEGKNNGSDGYFIRQTTKNKYTPIIATMLHSSLRSSSLCSIAFTLGLSFDTSALQINSLFPGVSLMVGKKDKIIFTAGPSFRKVTEINSSRYNIDQFVAQQPDNYTVNSFRIGYFFGISWNLTTTQKNIVKIGT